MPAYSRLVLVCITGLVGVTQSGCVSSHQYRQAQMQCYSVCRQNQAYLAQNSNLEERLRIANQRIDNLASERNQLQERFVKMLKGGKSPLSSETTKRFEELAKKYPEFEFDPVTGVSKFNTDILFGSGSSDIRNEAGPLLQEFASIMNQGEAKKLNILVVGHTDDKPILKKATQTRHATNWHLSTNRANSVLLALSKQGLSEGRMGCAGYSMFQPVVANKDEDSRQRNRRVEIFVLAPDAVVAGWDPKTSRN